MEKIAKRKQLRKRFDSEAEARAELSKVLDQRASGTYVMRRADTMRKTAERWIAGRTKWAETTKVGHQNRLKPLIVLYGDLPIQDLKKGASRHPHGATEDRRHTAPQREEEATV